MTCHAKRVNERRLSIVKTLLRGDYFVLALRQVHAVRLIVREDMVKRELVHPDILGALARAGHGSKILIADGDYPVATTKGPNAVMVHLNLSPGVVGALEVLSVVLATVVIEAAVVMDVPDGDPPPSIWGDFKTSLEQNGCVFPLKHVKRLSFYKQVSEPETALVIQTGETREYANLLLTIGSLW